MTAFVLKEFRQRTGIAAAVVSAGTGELLSRLKSESRSPRADVLWGGGAESLDSARELFAPYRSVEAAAVPIQFKDPDGLWTGFTVIPMVIVYNRALVPREEIPRAWRDLARPFFRGRVAFADPERSGSAYTALATMLRALAVPSPGVADGPLGTAESWAFVDELLTAIAGVTLSESEAVYGGVAAGEYFAGISFETAALSVRRLGGDLEFVYPEEGTSAVPDGVALIAGAPNAREAEAFIDFVLSREVQAMVRERWSRRSVRPDVAAPQGATPLASLRLVPYERRTAARERERVLAEWRRRLDARFHP
jgi:iron(III) transport system substrate-binding protein